MVLKAKDKNGIRGNMGALERGQHLDDLNVDLFVASTVYADTEVYLNMLRDMLNLSVLSFNEMNAKEQIVFIKALTNIANAPSVGKAIKDYMQLNPVNITSRIQYAVWIIGLYNHITGENMTMAEYVHYLTNEYTQRADAIKFSLISNTEDGSTEEETDTL